MKCFFISIYVYLRLHFDIFEEVSLHEFGCFINDIGLHACELFRITDRNRIQNLFECSRPNDNYGITQNDCLTAIGNLINHYVFTYRFSIILSY